MASAEIRPGGVRPRRRACRLLLVLALGCLLHCGCGGRGYQLAPVSGRVTLDNKPLADVVVNFQPRQEGNATPGPGSFGKTDAEGRYWLRTIEEPPVDGAVVGKHIVTIRASLEKTLTTDESVAPPVILPQEATNGSLSLVVPPEGSEQADFKLTSP